MRTEKVRQNHKCDFEQQAPLQMGIAGPFEDGVERAARHNPGTLAI